MTRIIGGAAGSRILVTPGPHTRPTSDRVREAWFSKLEAHNLLDGAVVLDLFAGSGALGLEAASRGASSVTLVDKHPGSAKAMATNVAALKDALPHAPTISIHKSTAVSYLARSPEAQFDLVFIDPPYDHSESDIDAVLGALSGWLAPGAWVMLERSSRSTPPEWPEGLEHLDAKTYGETTLYFAEES